METYSNYDDVPSTSSYTTGSENIEGENNWIPEEYRGGQFDKFQTPADLCKAYQNLSNLLSKRREDFSLEDKQAFLQMREEAYGIPQGPEGYQIDISPIREGSWNYIGDQELEYLKDMSSSLGLTNDQAQLQYDLINGFVENSVQESEAQLENAAVNNGSILAQMWGDGNIEQCIADVETGISVAARAIGCDEEELKAELEFPVGQLCSPNLINLLRGLAQLGGQGYGHGLSAGRTPSDAANELELLKNSEEYKRAIRMRSGPEYTQMLARVKALSDQVYGE